MTKQLFYLTIMDINFLSIAGGFFKFSGLFLPQNEMLWTPVRSCGWLNGIGDLTDLAAYGKL